MRKSIKIHVIMLRAAAALLILVLITSSIISGRYARYVTTTSGSAEARVAKFVVTQSILHEHERIDQTQTVSMPTIKPGETVQIDIEVLHDTETSVRDIVNIKSLYDNLPLTFSVQEAGTVHSDSATFEAVYLPGNFTKKKYEALITWAPGSNDVDYIGMVDMLVITVTSEQVD